MLDEKSLNAWMTTLASTSLAYQTELESEIRSSLTLAPSSTSSFLSAYKLAATYVSGVLRKDGIPYINHPLRLAMTLKKWFGPVWPATWIEQLQVIALFHDALEEGPGVSLQTYEQLTAHLVEIGLPKDEAPWLAGTAVILTEPEFEGIDLASIPKKQHYLLRKGAMAYQASDWVLDYWSPIDPKRSALILATALSDKLTNLFDLNYILKDSTKSESEKYAKIRSTFFYHAFCLNLYQSAIQRLTNLSGLGAQWTSTMQPLISFSLSCKSLLLQNIIDFGWSEEEFFGPSNPLTRYWTEHHTMIIKSIKDRIQYLT